MKTELAYLAGAIDSDGTIGIKRSTYAMRVTQDSKSPTFSERVALRQVVPIIPEMLKAKFGGSLYMTAPSTPNGKPLYSWAATDLRAAECLNALLPYLRIKKAQAVNCLELRKVKTRSIKLRLANGRGHVGAASRPLSITAEMESLYLHAKSLNAVGR